MKVADVIKLQHLKLVYEYFSDILPPDICHYFTPASNLCQNLRSTSSKCLFLHPITTNYAGSLSIRHQCAILWNHYMTKHIPLDEQNSFDINKICNVHQFKRLLKKHFRFTYTLID